MTDTIVIPDPENDTVAPAWKPVPVTTMFWLAWPRAREFGLSDVIVGRRFTVNAFAFDAVPPSDGLRTVRFLAPTAASPRSRR